jgi:hypothetical protein
VDLRNWELFTITGNPVVGATVEVREAVLTHPNVGTVIASTVTNVDGMYSFSGLPEGPKDVKLTYQGKIKWLKGMTIHSVSLVIGEDFVPPDVNLLRNGGFETWRLLSYQISTLDTPIALGWLAKIGAGDVAVVSREGSTVSGSKSRYALKAIYTKSAGPLYIYQRLPAGLVHQLRGSAVTLSVPVQRGVASSAQALIREGAVDTLGTADAAIGAFGTLTVTKTIGAAVTSLAIGILVNLSDTVYVDNATLVLGSVAGVFQPRVPGNDYDQVDYGMLDRAFARSFLLGAP